MDYRLKMPTIILHTEINAPIEKVFDLSRSIELHTKSTWKSNEEAIAGVTSGLISKGEQVTWRATHLGIRQTLTTLITEMNAPVYFQDKMIKGAFTKMVHDHIFEQKENHVLMKDVFIFESPGGIIGRIFNNLFLTAYMKKFLEQRNRMIKEYAETNSTI